MPLQAFVSPDSNRLYSPNRDLAHCFGWMIRELQKRTEHRYWAGLEDMARQAGVTDEELARGLDALARFTLHATDYGEESLREVMDRMGWTLVPDRAQVVLMAYLGAIVLGCFFVGVNEACAANDAPTSRYPDLRAGARAAAYAARQQPWRRVLRYAWQDTRRALGRRLAALRAFFRSDR